MKHIADIDQYDAAIEVLAALNEQAAELFNRWEKLISDIPRWAYFLGPPKISRPDEKPGYGIYRDDNIVLVPCWANGNNCTNSQCAILPTEPTRCPCESFMSPGWMKTFQTAQTHWNKLQLYAQRVKSLSLKESQKARN